VLGRSPGQARAHTGEVGVGVGVGRASTTGRGVVRPTASALASLHAARTGTGWLSCTASAGPRGVGDGCWVGLGFQPGFILQPMLILKILFFSFSKSVYNLQINLNSIQI
jgi:hypothetical protein